MIHVSQGHEKGIGLEVFFKSLLSLNSKLSTKFTLHCNQKTLIECLNLLNIEYKLAKEMILFEGREMPIVFCNDGPSPQSTVSLESCLNAIKENDILITLPTSKDQLIFNSKSCSGYTEYFRAKYSNNNLVMIFKGIEGFTALLTDHIPLKEVSQAITKDLVIEKFKVIKEGLEKFYKKEYQYIFSGINPHAGENGILGNEDSTIFSAVSELQQTYLNLKVKGALPGDTLHFEKGDRSNKVFIYSSHDQGLSVFKDQNGLFGINTTLGLPFLRLSVDHGTAFELYGKNKADFKGSLFVIKEALRIQS